MPTFTMTKQYDDGTVLTEAMLDSMKSSTEAFLNTTKLDGDNIQDGGIDADALATSAVTTTKLAAASVTLAKLAAEVTAVTLPSGMIAPYGASTAPTGWLLCDGSQVSRATYSALFSVIGENFGQGDNSTTFHLPDFRGRFLRGITSDTARDPDYASRTAMNTGGNEDDGVGSVQASAMLTHTHTATDSGHTHTATDAGHTHSSFALTGSIGEGNVFAGDNTGYVRSTVATGSGTASISVSTNTANVTNANAGSSTETRPINANVQYIIKI